MTAHRIPNDGRFRALWSGPRTIEEVGEIYGVRAATVKAAARLYGLPHRVRGGSAEVRQRRREAAEAEMSQAERDRKAAAVARARPLTARLAARGLPPERAERLALGLAQAASYGELAGLAEAFGLAQAWLLPLWHEVRV